MIRLERNLLEHPGIGKLALMLNGTSAEALAAVYHVAHLPELNVYLPLHNYMVQAGLTKVVGGKVRLACVDYGESDTLEMPECLQTPAFMNAWALWVEHRKQIRKKLTPLAIKQAWKKMAELGPERAVAAIQNSIACGYQGIFEPKGHTPPPASGKERGDHLREVVEQQRLAREREKARRESLQARS